LRKPCLVCGRLTERSSYCKRHQPPRTAPTSVDRIHWRKAAKARARNGNRCQVCGADAVLEVHHLIAVSPGGDHSLGNLITLCADCHRRLHGQRNP
jgi:5-methylcytosine-specific restriction endonuclease McrA